MSSETKQKWYCGLVASIGWFAVILQLILMLQNRVAPVGETIIRFFSFFTILTNILAAIYFSTQYLLIDIRRTHFVFKSATATAITVYIVVVGLVYNTILRQLWNPQGWQYLVDLILHTIIPLFTLLFWMVFVKDKNLAFKTAIWWLLYPAIYCIYVLVRGAGSNFYPYSFIDVSKLGFQKVLMNCMYITLLFLLLSFVFLGVGKLIYRRKRQ